MDTTLHRIRRHWAIPLALASILCLALAAPTTAADPSRPFGGFTTSAVETSGPPVGCPDGALIRYSAEAKGIFMHIGLAEFAITHCTWVNLATGAGTIDNGAVTITAADGDTLVLAHHGTFQLMPWPNPTTNNPHLVWVVLGGTGRFAGASGSGEASVNSDYVSGVTTSTWWGTIAY